MRHPSIENPHIDYVNPFQLDFSSLSLSFPRHFRFQPICSDSVHVFPAKSNGMSVPIHSRPSSGCRINEVRFGAEGLPAQGENSARQCEVPRAHFCPKVAQACSTMSARPTRVQKLDSKPVVSSSQASGWICRRFRMGDVSAGMGYGPAFVLTDDPPGPVE